MKKVIGIVGTTAAGKDVAAVYLASRLDIPSFQISQPIRDEAAARGLAEEWQTLVDLGREMARMHGPDHLAKLLLGKVETAGIISGLRQIPQIEYLRANSELTLVSLDADPAIRFARAKERGRLGEGESLEEFVRNELAENTGGVQDVWACMEMADLKIRNEGSLEELWGYLDAIIEKF